VSCVRAPWACKRSFVTVVFIVVVLLASSNEFGVVRMDLSIYISGYSSLWLCGCVRCGHMISRVLVALAQGEHRFTAQGQSKRTCTVSLP
jgi:hypothetical protein